MQVNCSWKWIVDWQWIGKIFYKKFLQFSLLVVNHVLWVNSIAAIKSHVFVAYNSLILSNNWLLMAAIEFTQSTWFTTSKVNCKIFLCHIFPIHFQSPIHFSHLHMIRPLIPEAWLLKSEPNGNSRGLNSSLCVCHCCCCLHFAALMKFVMPL